MSDPTPTDLSSQIAAILDDDALDLLARKRKLVQLAIAAMDRDDRAGYDAVIVAVEDISSEEGNRRRFQPSRAFRLMYGNLIHGERDGGQNGSRIVEFNDKHDRTLFDISTPDKFALAMLSVVKARLAQGWYAQPTLSPEENPSPLAMAWLDALRASPDVWTIDATKPLPDICRAMRTSAGMSVLNREIGTSTIWSRLCAELDAPSPDDIYAAFLAYGIYLIQSDYQSAIKAKLQTAQPGSLCRRLAESLPASDEEEARRVLDLGRTELRRAGRMAYEFLMERSRRQYEDMRIIYLSEPDY